MRDERLVGDFEEGLGDDEAGVLEDALTNVEGGKVLAHVVHFEENAEFGKESFAELDGLPLADGIGIVRGGLDGVATLQGGCIEDAEVALGDGVYSLGIEGGTAGLGDEVEDPFGIMQLDEDLELLGHGEPFVEPGKDVTVDGGHIDLLDAVGPLALDGDEEGRGGEKGIGMRRFLDAGSI